MSAKEFIERAVTDYRFYDAIEGIPKSKKIHESEWLGVMHGDMKKHLLQCKINPKTGKKKKVNGKGKGDQFERDVANMLKPLYPKAQRANQNKVENEVADVEGTPFWVECKAIKSIAAFRFWDQAKDEVKKHDDKRPIMVVMKENRTAKNGAVNLAMVDMDLMLAILMELDYMGIDIADVYKDSMMLNKAKKVLK